MQSEVGYLFSYEGVMEGKGEKSRERGRERDSWLGVSTTHYAALEGELPFLIWG